jgi:multidrug efflux pump
MINNLIDAFVNRSRVTILLMAVLLFWGYLTYISIPKESTPDVKIPIIYTVVVYEGISPEDSERLLLKPLEKYLRDVEGVKEITSYAFEGSASIVLEFHAGFNSDKALNDVRAKVQDAEGDLPVDAKKPMVHEINLGKFPVLNVILYGDIPETTVIKHARTLKTKIESIHEVLSVNVAGEKEDSLEIIIEPRILETYGLSISSISQIINSNNQVVAAGSLRGKTGEFTIKVPSLINDFETLMNFPVKIDGDSVVKVKDIAKVYKTYKEPKTTARVNGKPAIVIEISKRTGENIINTIRKVKAVVEEEKSYWPDNLAVKYANDQSSEIIEMVSDLENNIILGTLLVVIVVIVSVGYRSALLISLSIPFSFLLGVLLLGLTDHTLNLVVLFSLILTIGMIVDDAIVVSEFADRIMKEGVPPSKAFILSAKRMLWPIVTSTVVKIVVFLPLLFWPGVVGQFMKYMPITVITILSNSLLFALFFQPTLGPLFGKPKNVISRNDWDENSIDKVDLSKLKGFTAFYYNMLIKVLEHPKKFVLSIMGLLVFVYAFFISFGTGIEFFPKIEPNSANVSVMSSGNLSLNERQEIMNRVEERILKFSNEIKIVYAKAGIFDTSSNMPEDTIGTVFIEFNKWNTRRKAVKILADISKSLWEIHGIKIETVENQDGPPPDKPVKFNISSRNFKELSKNVDKILSAMDKMGGFIDIEDSRSKSAIEWQIIPDREKAARFGVDINTIGNTVKLISNGLKVSSYRPDDSEDEVDILLRFPPEYRNITTLDSINVVNFEGDNVPMSNFVLKTASPKVGMIKRVNREKIISIKANVKKGLLVDTEVKKLKQFFKNSGIESSVKISFKGEDKDQKEAGDFLSKAFIITLIMMFVVMLIQFNNYYHTIIVMSAVFLSTVGVLLGLVVTWQPFGIVMCGIGIISLGGIVLNNNILFIDTYQHLRHQGVDVYEAIIRSGVQRSRPILLTAATAVLGLLPMVIGVTFNFIDRDILYDTPSSQWWRQLSAAIAGGLTFATILTLFFTPCLLLIGKRFDIDKKL